MTNKTDIGKMILRNLKFSKLMKNAYKNYLDVEKSIENRLSELEYGEDFIFPNKKLSFIESYKKNFFTFLMLSILDNMKIKKERLIKYGEINFCLRTIVTSTDNMIDNEKKGVIFLNNIENKTVNNTLLIMTMQNVMSIILRELGDHGETLNFILNKIHSIAKCESLRDVNIYDEYPDSTHIINEIHRGIGGELLQLSLWAPTVLEKELTIVKEYNKALFFIGMALQGLDDLCDMKEDYDASQVNLGIARLKYSFNLNTDIFSGEFDNNVLIKDYSEIYNSYVDECIKTALKGFEKLKSLNYPISHKESIVLLKYLFELRGIKELWDISKYS